MLALYVGWLPALICLVACAIKGRAGAGIIGALVSWPGVGGLVLASHVFMPSDRDTVLHQFAAFELIGVAVQFIVMAFWIARVSKPAPVKITGKAMRRARRRWRQAENQES
ncbi:MAG: hypothetical protein KF878_09895 [Planctomycetes bacterium]|nr:hypothetical protein [Planctomycetota bacterium]